MTMHIHEPRQQSVDSTQEALTQQLVTFINNELLVEESTPIDGETPLSRWVFSTHWRWCHS